MTDVEPAADGLAVAYRCSGCSRSFIDLGEASSRELVCTCGAPLAPRPLPHGLHELGPSVQPNAHKAAPASSPIPKEPDHGYGASHGYDVTHGGPSGPGDAPADVPDEIT